MHEKTMTPRSYLRWKPTGKIFKTVGRIWVPTGKIFASSINKVDSEPQNGSNEDITNQNECEQTLDVSAGTLNLSAGTSFNPKKEGLKVIQLLGCPIPAESDSLPHSQVKPTKTYYKHQDSRTMKAQKLKTKTSANSDIKDNSSETKLQGRLLASFQDDAK
ncbi:hypothetical protein Tco_0816071 [Tanacetum coccineum]